MQVKKDKVKEQVLSAALSHFCAYGFSHTSIAQVAKLAGISTGNVYRYFSSKEVLFSAVLPQEFVDEFTSHVKQLMHLAINERNFHHEQRLSNAEYWQHFEFLMDLSYAQRERVLILLSSERDAPHEGFRQQLIELMEYQALHYAQKIIEGRTFSASERFILHLIYAAFVESLTKILKESASKSEMKEHLHHLRQYHLSGLQNFFKEEPSRLKKGGVDEVPSNTQFNIHSKTAVRRSKLARKN